MWDAWSFSDTYKKRSADGPQLLKVDQRLTRSARVYFVDVFKKGAAVGIMELFRGNKKEIGAAIS